MQPFFAIFDKANGILQWHGLAKSFDKAWELFRSDLGYDEDIPGVCEREKYEIVDGPEARKHVKDIMGH